MPRRLVGELIPASAPCFVWARAIWQAASGSGQLWLAGGLLSSRLLVGQSRGSCCCWSVASRCVSGGLFGFNDADKVVHGLILYSGGAQYLAAHVEIVYAGEEYVFALFGRAPFGGPPLGRAGCGLLAVSCLADFL